MIRRGQQRHGRRGAVFPLRLTDEERGQIEQAQRQGGGPRSIGAWMRWAAIERAAQVIPSPAIERVLPELAPRHGNTDPGGPGPVIPDLAVASPGAGPVLPPQRDRVILDLCGGSGAWSQPYRDAGYRVELVSLPEHDVRLLPARTTPVWGVLAAPPCEVFSLAANGHGSDFQRDFARGLAVVDACLRVIWQVRARWWALENPIGLLQRFLGTPRYAFEPCDHGNPWTKRTGIWGEFTIPRPGPFVRPLGGGPFCSLCDPEGERHQMCSDPAHRAVTPSGFARAFAEANP